MKFRFPLQKVLEHRKLLENLAQKDFQEAADELRRHRDHLRELEETMHEAFLRSYKMERVGGTHAAASLIQAQEFIRGQQVRISRQNDKIRKQEILVEEKRDVLRQSATDTKIIAKLKEKRLEEFQRESDRKEQLEMDESSVLRYKTPDSREK